MRARQKVSRAGVELIKSFEGLRTVAARLPDGRWTLGYGHTFSAREGARATQEDADALLRFDLLPIVDALNNMVLVPLNQNQFDALVSFCFNIGTDNFAASTVLKRINEGRFADAALAMDSWRSAEFNGQTYVLAPLIRRRAAEKSLFMSPEETSQPSGLMMRPIEDMSDDIPTFARAPEMPSAPPPHLAPTEVYNPEVAPAPASLSPVALTPVAVTPVALPPVDAPGAPAYLSPYASSRPVEAPADPAPVVAPVQAPAPTYSSVADYRPAPDHRLAPVAADRQVIDLSSYASNVVPEAATDAVPIPKPTIVRMADVSPYQPEPVRPDVISSETVSSEPVRSELPVVEHLPDGVIPASVVREMPPVNPYASQFAPQFSQPAEDPEPRMSAEVQAALQRAKEEEALREETLRQARAMAAARQAEELRMQDEARLREEATRQYDLQRQEALRAEAARQEQVRQEQLRQEQLRIDYERHERERQEQLRLEQAMAMEAARAEAVRAEQERLDAERREADRQAYLRQETERQEAQRLEAQRIEAHRVEAARFEAERVEAARVEAARVEAARVERERIEREQVEQARLEQARLEQARLEQARLEQARLEHVKREQEAETARQAAASPMPAAEDEAEKARKAEAAAALMRLYSPYGSGALGRPLTSPSAQPAPLVPQQPTPPPASPFSSAPIEVSSRPEGLSPAQSATQAFGHGFGQAFGQSVPLGFAQAPSQPAPQPVQSPAPSLEPQTDALSVPTQEPGTIRHFAPVTSASTLPPPTVVAMSPYAQPIRATEPEVVEVPRPTPINLAAPSMAPIIEAARATEPEPALHWRDQLQRPLPQDYEAPDARRAPRPGPLSSAATHYEQDLSNEDDWTMDGGRIAVSSEDHSDAGPSFGSMIVSTRWVLFSSSVAMACLGFAAGFYVKSKDLTIIRNGLFTNYMWWSVGLAAIGILFLSISVWQIMKRLGGLKD